MPAYSAGRARRRPLADGPFITGFSRYWPLLAAPFHYIAIIALIPLAPARLALGVCRFASFSFPALFYGIFRRPHYTAGHRAAGPPISIAWLNSTPGAGAS